MGSLSQWLSYLESIHPTSIDMGLERVKSVADRLSFNWDSIKVITVGGTNGKGTTCRFLEHYFVATGRSVATFRSPHLIDYRERVTLNGVMRDEQEYVTAFEQVEAARGDITLTYFEFGTLAALVMMQTWQPDIALLEVGLGGRLDATNIIDNDCAVITTIGLDHQDYLGDTRDAIAIEKAGIIRPHSPVVIGELESPTSLLNVIAKKGEQAIVADRDFSFEVEKELHNTTSLPNKSWRWTSGNTVLENLPLPRIPIQNASTALAVIQTIDTTLNAEQVVNSCKHASLPGRQQVLSTSPFVMVDVAHNPQGAQSLVDIIKWHSQKGSQKRTVGLVIGMLKDKDIESTLSCFMDIPVRWYLADTLGSRGCSASQLKHVIESLKSNAESTITHTTTTTQIMAQKTTQKTIQRVSTFSNVTSAYKDALTQSSASDSIFVFGSFLTVADVLAYHGGTQSSLGVSVD